jgi:hypothetical protein
VVVFNTVTRTIRSTSVRAPTRFIAAAIVAVAACTVIAAPAYAAGTCTITITTPARVIAGDDYIVKVKPSAACHDGHYHQNYGSLEAPNGNWLFEWNWDSNSSNTITATAPSDGTYPNVSDNNASAKVAYLKNKMIVDPNSTMLLTNRQSGTTANLTARVSVYYNENSRNHPKGVAVELQRKRNSHWLNLKSARTNSHGVASFPNVKSARGQQYRAKWHDNFYLATSNTVKVR